MFHGHTSAGLPYVIHDGHPRILAAIPPVRTNRLGLPSWSATMPMLPRSQWQTFGRRKQFSGWIEDQNGFSSCVGNGSVGALRRARSLAGCTDVRLSPGYLYSLINGGRDQGAVISDAADALQQQGTCSYATVGETPIYTAQMLAAARQEAQRFRADKVYHADSYDALGSGLSLGYVAVYGVMVGDSFMSFDRYGVAGHTSGPGNHCMCGQDVVQLPDGRQVIDNVNSWGLSFGPQQDGCCYLDEEHFASIQWD